MSDKPFIKFYPGDFLAGTSGLSPAERGVYITLLCLIYENDAPIERDDARLARRCGAPKAAFVKILSALIGEGKITDEGGMLSNRRAEKALMDRTNRSQNATHASNARWTAQSGKSEQNQSPDDAPAMPPQSVADASQSQSQKEKKKPSVSQKTTGSRLPKDFEIPPDWIAWAVEEASISEVSARREASKFCDFWWAKAGKDAAKVDWLATWRGWVRRAVEQRPALKVQPIPKQAPLIIPFETVK